MNILNVEFKAKVKSNGEAEQKLLTLNPVYIGEDHQIDTYFNVLTVALSCGKAI